ncbi:hypothetical protein R1flu_023567 [Riccia fluitans]|uniref:Uncharacterized protein n=1 Tax=Riccia fluitans TaxID=41844 RepID=A0ABD1XSW1_9MARC
MAAVRSTMRLQGRVAVVTGGASGIGKATVKTFVEHGARVIIADIQDALGESLAHELGGPGVARYIHCNVSQEGHVAAAVDLSVNAFGGLDIMYNNAGVSGVHGAIDEILVENLDQQYGVLLRGVFLGMKHAARVMKPALKGSIITTSSVAGHIGGMGSHTYTTLKHALTGLTRSVATELRDYQIRVNNISPGAVDTPIWSKPPFTPSSNLLNLPFFQSSKEGVARMVSRPESIANAALFLASDESSYVSGHCLVVDGSHMLHPNWAMGRSRFPLDRYLELDGEEEDDHSRTEYLRKEAV